LISTISQYPSADLTNVTVMLLQQRSSRGIIHEIFVCKTAQ
jgi:hypothetical protein